MRAQTVGSWKHMPSPVLFLSGRYGQYTMQRLVHPFPTLLSLHGGQGKWDEIFDGLSRWHVPVMFDSGCFTLATELRLKGVHQMSHPEKAPSWPIVWETWSHCMTDKEVSSSVWGIIEIDGGSWEDKMRRREKHEDIVGAAPIPVWHVGDPWHYLHTLVDRYDRVALGFPRQYRRDNVWLRILAELSTRFAGTDTWFHLLGMDATSTSWWTFPEVNVSGDTATWAALARFGDPWRPAIAMADRGGQERHGRAAGRLQMPAPASLAGLWYQVLPVATSVCVAGLWSLNSQLAGREAALGTPVLPSGDLSPPDPAPLPAPAEPDVGEHPALEVVPNQQTYLF